MSSPAGIILPITYFPPVSYFSCLASGRDILIETGETFPKQTLRNRCEIAGSAGKQILIVPVHKPAGNHTKTYQVLISTHEDWRIKHWRAIETTYSSSPFFLYYSDEIHDILFGEGASLAEKNMEIMLGISSLIGLKSGFTLSNGYLKETNDLLDLRGAFSKHKASWNGKLEPYLQVFSHKNGFLEDLSILDLLFNLGPESLSYLQRAATVIG